MKNFSIFFAFAIIACQCLSVEAFLGQKGPAARSPIESNTRLGVGPLQKLTNRAEYNKVVDGLMFTKGLSREEAEKEYDAYLNNPNDYALNKVSLCKLWSSTRTKAISMVVLTSLVLALLINRILFQLRGKLTTSLWDTKV